MSVHELICQLEESSQEQKSFCAIFDEGLRAYTRQSWKEAIKVFGESRKIRLIGAAPRLCQSKGWSLS